MTRPRKSQEEIRERALTAFLDSRVREGFRTETHTDTHAIIGPADRGWSFLDLRAKSRQVISVDEHGEVRVAAAEPVRS